MSAEYFIRKTDNLIIPIKIEIDGKVVSEISDTNDLQAKIDFTPLEEYVGRVILITYVDVDGTKLKTHYYYLARIYINEQGIKALDLRQGKED